MAHDATGVAPDSGAAVFRGVTNDYLRALEKENRKVKHAHRLAARCVLAGITVRGACVVSGRCPHRACRRRRS